jgi:hypothetical protein
VRDWIDGPMPDACARRILAQANVTLPIRDGLIGLGTNPPPHLGQTLPRMRSTPAAQNVHSYVQMRASTVFGASAVLQCSQVGLSSSIVLLCNNGINVRVQIFRTADVRLRTSAVRVMSVVAGVSPPYRGPVGQ